MRPFIIVVSIVVALVALGGLAVWDDARSSAAALDDFGHEQVMLARMIAEALRLRQTGLASPDADDTAELRAAFAPLSETDTVALLTRPGRDEAVTSLGTRLTFAEGDAVRERCTLDRAPDRRCWLRIAADRAVSLSLPARTAMAGVSGFVDRSGGEWRVAVVASARRERDRERRAHGRLVLIFLLSSGLVFGFGTLALQLQKRELALARELAVKEAVRERDERLLRADKLATMGAFATGIAHEVATPLGVIVARAEQLGSRVEGDERATRAVAAIAEQAERIRGIVQAFLSLARGETPLVERVDVSLVASSAVQLVEHRFDESGVRLQFEPETELPIIACDRRLMEQAFANLLLNACDACEEAGHVEVRLERTEGGVAFVVEDDGIGISAESAKRATEPFFTTKPAGTGLGLAITNEIVLHHQGHFTLVPRTGRRGTTARIDLPTSEDKNG